MHYKNGRNTALRTLGIKQANAMTHVPGLGSGGGGGGISPMAKLRLLHALTGAGGGAVGGALMDSEDRGRGAMLGAGATLGGHALSAGAQHAVGKAMPAVGQVQDAVAQSALRNPGLQAGLGAGAGMLTGGAGSGLAGMFRGNPEEQR